MDLTAYLNDLPQDLISADKINQTKLLKACF